ncbi:Uncharacterised protein [Vibrio cholerae]|nr:hypothetical protein DN38_3203 [Vibrio cholerae]CSA29632.1 Uncharacterised protein [Vibrio cholerae]
MIQLLFLICIYSIMCLVSQDGFPAKNSDEWILKLQKWLLI